MRARLLTRANTAVVNAGDKTRVVDQFQHRIGIVLRVERTQAQPRGFDYDSHVTLRHHEKPDCCAGASLASAMQHVVARCACNGTPHISRTMPGSPPIPHWRVLSCARHRPPGSAPSRCNSSAGISSKKRLGLSRTCSPNLRVSLLWLIHNCSLARVMPTYNKRRSSCRLPSSRLTSCGSTPSSQPTMNT